METHLLRASMRSDKRLTQVPCSGFVREERGKHARNFPWGLKSYAVGNFPRRLFVRKNVCRFNGERISLGALCNLKAAHIPLLQEVM
jgi:hypothetical protein